MIHTFVQPARKNQKAMPPASLQPASTHVDEMSRTADKSYNNLSANIPHNFSHVPSFEQMIQTCGCAKCTECDEEENDPAEEAGGAIQHKLTVSQPGDPFEREADQVAEQVMNTPEGAGLDQETPTLPAPAISRWTGNAGDIRREEAEEEQDEDTAETEEEQHEKLLNISSLLSCKGRSNNIRPPSTKVTKQIHSMHRGGKPMDTALRDFFEPRFQRDFSNIRLHTDARAAETTKSLNARAYTVGENIAVSPEEYQPNTQAGRKLLAHELTHVVQQNALPSSKTLLQRVPLDPGTTADVVAEREYGDSGAPKAKKSIIPAHCPPGFCDPYSSQELAEYYRAKKSWWIMAGISAFVDSRVVPLWKEYLWGGSAPKNLTADFGKDFTGSPDTLKATGFLENEIKKSLAAKPPLVPISTTIHLKLSSLIPTAIAALDDPASPNRMNFKTPKDIAGNIAGDIGKDQTKHLVGAMPSPFNDERKADGSVQLSRKTDSTITVTPLISYSVKDTIDLCPGDCGAPLEQVATVPLSQFEATGISGDVPFTIDFPAPSLGTFTITAPAGPPAPIPKAP
jgi:hypothetical protein